MKTLKIKLNYSELTALDVVLQSHIYEVGHGDANWEEKCIQAVLVTFLCKKIKPLTYFQYHKAKSISVDVATACALIYLQLFYLDLLDPYQNNVMQRIIEAIHPKLITP